MNCSTALALDTRKRIAEGCEKPTDEIEGPPFGQPLSFQRGQLRDAFTQTLRQVIQVPAHRERWPAIEVLRQDIGVAEMRLTPEFAVESIYLLADEIADIAEIQPTAAAIKCPLAEASLLCKRKQLHFAGEPPLFE